MQQFFKILTFRAIRWGKEFSLFRRGAQTRVSSVSFASVLCFWVYCMLYRALLQEVLYSCLVGTLTIRCSTGTSYVEKSRGKHSRTIYKTRVFCFVISLMADGPNVPRLVTNPTYCNVAIRPGSLRIVPLIGRILTQNSTLVRL